jgi:hypothetical protein
LTEENNINYIEKNKSRQNPLFYYYWYIKILNFFIKILLYN